MVTCITAISESYHMFGVKWTCSGIVFFLFIVCIFFFFFFQAEDGIRDLYVTGVQTCALPILTFRTRLTYRVKENPFLTETEFVGSRALSRERILQLLKQRNIAPRLGEPANEAALYGAALAIREALGELGYPQARGRTETYGGSDATLPV